MKRPVTPAQLIVFKLKCLSSDASEEITHTLFIMLLDLVNLV